MRWAPRRSTAPSVRPAVTSRAAAYADLLFVEGAALFRAYGHGDEATLRRELAAAAAERTVLVNLNEHLQRMTTDELRNAAAVDGFELGDDFAVYER